jgi:hypothetical protein
MYQRLHYGWVMLGAVSITEVVSWGILYSAFSVFVAPMQAERSWSQVAITGPSHSRSSALDWQRYQLAAGSTAMARES